MHFSSSEFLSRAARVTASVSLSALLGVLSILPLTALAASPASVQVRVPVSIGVNQFYDRLSPYGDWVDWGGRWVWVPNDVDPSWRPYTFGHWAYTEVYGWIWVSDEPFGWATYHYGCWGYSPEIGWFWVPGTRWAPAWVSWRRAPGYIAWAPLAPTGYGFDFSYGDEPSWYWQAVPARAFLSINISNHIVRDYGRVDRIWHESRPLGSVTVINNMTVNNVINVNEVERVTRRQVVPYDVAPARSPDEAGRVQGRALHIFNPQVAASADQSAPPPRHRAFQDVVREREQDQRIGGGVPRGAEHLIPPVRVPEEAPPPVADDIPANPGKHKGQNMSAPDLIQPDLQQEPQHHGRKQQPPFDQGQPDVNMGQPQFEQPMQPPRRKPQVDCRDPANAAQCQ